MTVGVAYRVPSLGAVLVCDSRLIVEATWEISTDSYDKWFVNGSIAALCAGSAGGKWQDLLDSPPKNWKEFKSRVVDLHAKEKDLEYDVLVYDRAADRLIITDQSGCEVYPRLCGAIGSGGAYALGLLDGAKPPNTLETAEALCRKAVKTAIKRNAACGGKIRSITVTGKRGQIVVK